jgi:AcrR family transcriptional regulator
MTRSELLPAPGRGAYDRSLSRAQRDAQHRERLLVATAEVIVEGPATVARIVEHAGVGRSTFYEFFDSPEHVLEQLEQRALRSLATTLDESLRIARTPLERTRAIVRAWLDALQARPMEGRVALIKRANAELLSPAGKLLHRALERSAEVARQSGVGWLSSADDASLLGAAAAVEVVTRRHLAGPALPDVQRALTDMVAKLLR